MTTANGRYVVRKNEIPDANQDNSSSVFFDTRCELSIQAGRKQATNVVLRQTVWGQRNMYREYLN